MFRSHFIFPLWRGFLPLENPPQQLPEKTSWRWVNFELNRIIENLPQLVEEKKLRSEIDTLNAKYTRPDDLISLNQFDHREVENAWLVMTMLRVAYIREDAQNRTSAIPAILSDNFRMLERVNPRLPLLTYSDYVLHNWKLIDESKNISLENIAPIYTFTGHPDEASFIKIHVAVEAAFSDALVAAGQLVTWADRRQIVPLEKLGQCFGEMTRSIQKATRIIEKMQNGCDLLFFRTMLQSFLERADSINGKEYQSLLDIQSFAFLALDCLLSMEDVSDQSMSFDRMSAVHQYVIQRMERSDVQGLLYLNDCPGLAACKEAKKSLEIFRIKQAEIASYYFPAAHKSENAGCFKPFFGKQAEETTSAKEALGQPKFMAKL